MQMGRAIRRDPREPTTAIIAATSGSNAGSIRQFLWGAGVPVLLDLDGNGLTVDTLDTSSMFLDLDGDGYRHRTAWAGKGDGVLVLDADGDGRISRSSEFAFTEWDATADGDLEALRKVFDSNGNGKLDAGDARWSEFKVEVDGQLVSLASLGLASIDLTPTGSGQNFADGSAITGTAKFTRTDGTTGTAGDAVLAADAASYRIQRSTIANADQSTTETVAGFNRDGSTAFTSQITTSADGNRVLTRFDDNGDGVFDRSQSDDLVVSTNGTRTRTIANLNGDGSLRDTTATTTSADGKTVTTTLDQNGDGVVDQRQVFSRNSDGSSVTTVEKLNRRGTLLRKVVTTASADGLAKTVATDPTGSGVFDRTLRETTIVNTDKSRARSEALESRDGTLMSKTVTATSANGRQVSTSSDLDGDGDVDRRETTTLSVSATGSIVSVVDSFNGDGSRRGKAQVTTSADGLGKVSTADITGDGVTDRTISEITTVANGVRTETVEQRSANGALLTKTVTTTSVGAAGIRRPGGRHRRRCVRPRDRNDRRCRGCEPDDGFDP